jgi:hypothetical protein
MTKGYALTGKRQKILKIYTERTLGNVMHYDGENKNV